MKYAVETASGGMIYISSFITIGSFVQKLLGTHARTHTHRARQFHKPTLFKEGN
jgi:hypothetical protein